MTSPKRAALKFAHGDHHQAPPCKFAPRSIRELCCRSMDFGCVPPIDPPMLTSTHRSRLAFPVACCASARRCSQTLSVDRFPPFNVHANHTHRPDLHKLLKSLLIQNLLFSIYSRSVPARSGCDQFAPPGHRRALRQRTTWQASCPEIGSPTRSTRAPH
jgi:hypothetical protein